MVDVAGLRVIGVDTRTTTQVGTVPASTDDVAAAAAAATGRRPGRCCTTS